MDDTYKRRSIKFCYKNLANAIILQAVDDYRNLLRDKQPNIKYLEVSITEIEKFFRSEWFKILTDVDGEYIIKKLRKEYENGREVNSRNSKCYIYH
jgi:hypothetical protein